MSFDFFFAPLWNTIKNWKCWLHHNTFILLDSIGLCNVIQRKAIELNITRESIIGWQKKKKFVAIVTRLIRNPYIHKSDDDDDDG